MLDRHFIGRFGGTEVILLAFYLVSSWNAMSLFHHGANPSRVSAPAQYWRTTAFSPLFEHLQHKSCAWWNCSLRQWLSGEIMFAIYTSTRAWVMQLWQTCLLISAPSSWRKNARGFVFSRGCRLIGTTFQETARFLTVTIFTVNKWM